MGKKALLGYYLKSDQTMITGIIHQYVTDSYLDKEEINKFLQLKRA